MAKQPTPKDEKTLGEINEQFLLAKKYLDQVHQRMNDQEELYRTYIDANNYPHSAKVFDPRIFRIVETITPRMVSNEPTGSFYPVEEGDIATAQVLNSLIKYDWRMAEMFPKLVNFVKSMLIFGTAFGRTYWDFREATRKQMEPKMLNGKMIWSPSKTKEITITEYDGPHFEVLNISDCFPDPNSTTLNNMRWFLYRTFKTLKELREENDARGAEYWKNLDQLESEINKNKDAKRGSGRVDNLEFREHRRMMLSTEEFIGQDNSNPEFAVIIRYLRDRWTFIVPEYQMVIRDVPNPYFHGDLPIVYGTDYPYPGELYGMGEIEPVDRIQRAINAVLNQRLDNVQLVLRSMWKVRKNAGVDLHTLVSAPGNIITTDYMDAVEPIQVPDVTGPTFVNTMNYLTAALQNGSGITDYTIGIDNKANVANKTATGTRLVQQEANAQFKLKIQMFNHMVIQRIANLWKDMRLQYTTEAKKLRIIGHDEVKYMKEKTNLAQVDLEGMPIAPGELDVQSKLELSPDESFAFLNLNPEDIQPSIVGNYDFIAAPSSEQINDPIALQENFFRALELVRTPEWTQGLAMEQKKLNYTTLTEKVFDKLNIGLEMNDVVEEVQQPMVNPLAPEMNPMEQLQPQAQIPQPLMGANYGQGPTGTV